MTKYLPFVYDDNGFFTNQKCFFITTDTPAYLTAFFNSSLFKFCFRDNFPELQGGTRELSKIFFDKIPVLIVNKAVDNQFEGLVLSIQHKQDDTIAKEIDDKIADLYGLTQDERNHIGFIEIQ